MITLGSIKKERKLTLDNALAIDSENTDSWTDAHIRALLLANVSYLYAKPKGRFLRAPLCPVCGTVLKRRLFPTGGLNSRSCVQYHSCPLCAYEYAKYA